MAFVRNGRSMNQMRWGATEGLSFFSFNSVSLWRVFVQYQSTQPLILLILGKIFFIQYVLRVIYYHWILESKSSSRLPKTLFPAILMGHTVLLRCCASDILCYKSSTYSITALFSLPHVSVYVFLTDRNSTKQFQLGLVLKLRAEFGILGENTISFVLIENITSLPEGKVCLSF